MKRILYTIIGILATLLLLWLIASHLDLISDMTDTARNLESWNLYKIIFG